ncbi:MAG: class I SAM-dependent methyltransferase [Chloroflexota bacterium]|nr:class I SAM-dependent methyltransferase [Anaerolineales bacterium]
MIWIFIIAVLIIVGVLLDREIYFYEGAHLHPHIQAWLYDRWAKKYDDGKHDSQTQDVEMLAKPLLNALQVAMVPEPFVLDFATGTGRLSHALLNQPDFKGHIVAVDLSQGMLEQAASKLGWVATTEQGNAHHPLSARVELLRHLALPLPFPDATFDVVCALEVLELFPNMDKPLSELTRVLRPGGILLTSRGTEESGRKAVVRTEKAFTSLLERNGFEKVQITKWWKIFDRVIAVKNQSSSPVGVRKLSDVLCCQACHQTQWQTELRVWQCKNCGKELPVTKEGIVLN